MKKLLLSAITCLVFSLFSISQQPVTQEWVQRYNGPDSLTDVAITVDAHNCVLVTGATETKNNRYDFVTIKYSQQGNQEWVSTYNTPTANSLDNALSITSDKFCNVYVTGVVYYDVSTGNRADWVTIKYDSMGIEQWVVQYNGSGNGWDIPVAIAADINNNIYVSGYSQQASQFWDWDYVTIKYSTNGVKLWERNYDGPGNITDYVTGMAMDKNSNIYVTGRSIGIDLDQDYATIKYDTDGNQLWVARYDGADAYSQEESIGISVDKAGNSYVTGISYSSLYFSMVTIKYNASGVQQWVQSFDGSEIGSYYNNPVALAVDADNDVYVAAYTYGATYADYTTIKYSSDGNLQWIRNYNAAYDAPASLAVDANNNVYVTGYSSLQIGVPSDYTTVKYSPNGQEEWVQRYSGTGKDNYASKIAVSPSCDVYVTGLRNRYKIS